MRQRGGLSAASEVGNQRFNSHARRASSTWHCAVALNSSDLLFVGLRRMYNTQLYWAARAEVDASSRQMLTSFF